MTGGEHHPNAGEGIPVNLLDRAAAGNVFEAPELVELYAGDEQTQTLNLAMALGTAARTSHLYYIIGREIESLAGNEPQRVYYKILDNVSLAGAMMMAGQEAPFSYRVMHTNLAREFRVSGDPAELSSFNQDLAVVLKLKQDASRGQLSHTGRADLLTFDLAIRTTADAMCRQRFSRLAEMDVPPENDGISAGALQAYTNPEYWQGEPGDYICAPRFKDDVFARWAAKVNKWVGTGRWPQASQTSGTR